MAGAASDNTWNLSPPRRPSLADLGSATKEDDEDFPPDPQTMPTSAEINIAQKLMTQMLSGFWSLKLQVAPGASPSVQASWSMTTNAVTFTAVQNGTGDYTITWTAGAFPSSIHGPRAWITDTGKWYQPDAQVVSNGVRVKTYNSAGTATDANFIVEIY